MSEKIQTHMLFSKLNHILWRKGVKICGSIYARDLLITLMDMESKFGLCPSDESLAEINGVCTRTIARARVELKERGLISVRVDIFGARKNRRVKYNYTVNHDVIDAACLHASKAEDSKDCESVVSQAAAENDDSKDCESHSKDCESVLPSIARTVSPVDEDIEYNEDIIRIEYSSTNEAKDYKRRQAICWMQARFYHWDRVRSLGAAAVNYIADTIDEWRPNGELKLDTFNEYFENAKAGAYEMVTP